MILVMCEGCITSAATSLGCLW